MLIFWYSAFCSVVIHPVESCYSRLPITEIIAEQEGIIDGSALGMLGRLLTEGGAFAEAHCVLRRHLLARCETCGISGIMSSREEYFCLRLEHCEKNRQDEKNALDSLVT
jgi:hypothetical protein